jgi:hypothetical protein
VLDCRGWTEFSGESSRFLTDKKVGIIEQLLALQGEVCVRGNAVEFRYD